MKTSKLQCTVVAALFLVIATINVHAEENKVKKTPFVINKGVNIAHWTSQSDARGEEREKFFVEREVQQLARWGFDHIRLPVGEEQILRPDGTLDDETMTLIENAIGWCKKYGMRIIFDLHNVSSHHFNEENNTLWTSEEAQRKLCDTWRMIADRLDKYPETLLAFELLNEPVADDNADWNKVLDKLLPAVRAKNKKRVILVASNKWNSIDNIPYVRIPDNDPNIMLTFHFYEPMVLTHYRASWSALKHLDLEHGVKYPGQPVLPQDTLALSERGREVARWWVSQYYDKEWMRKRWKKAVDYAREKGLRLYLGEFGCLPTVEEQQRMAWINDVISLCNELGIPRAHWEYKSGFGFADWNTAELKNPALLETLVK